MDGIQRMTPQGSSHSIPVDTPGVAASPRVGALFHILHDAVLVVRIAERRIVDANPAALKLFGYTRAELVGSTSHKLHPDEAHFMRFGELARPILERGESGEIEITLRRKDGTLFPSHITLSPAGKLLDDGSVVLGLVRDLTPEVRRRERDAFLTEASTLLLKESLNPTETLRAIASLATKRLADYASVDLIDEAAQRVERVTIAHADPRKASLVERYAREYPPKPDLVAAMRRVAPDGALVLNDVDLRLIRGYATREGEIELIERIGLRHSLSVPLTGRHGILGAISFTRAAGAPFDDEDVHLAKELAARAALAYENATLHADLRDFVDTSAIGLHWVGPDGTILWANEADYAPMGYAKDEYVGRDIRAFHVDAHVIEDILQRLGRDERLHEYPARLLARDGTIRHVLIDSSVYWREGQFIHTRCFTRDVTAQVQAEARARASDDRLRRILATAPAQVTTLDREGRILTINRSLRGADPSSALGIVVYDTVVPEDRDRVRGIIERVMETGQSAEYETRALLGDGRVRWFHVRVGALEHEGRPGAVLVTTDIEERRNTEEEIARMRAQLIQGEKLAALGSLVSGVAHELRTPLTYLSNNAFVLESRLEGAAKRNAPTTQALADARPLLEDIKSGVERINSLVEDLRKYTKARQEATLVHAPLSSLLPEAVELFTATTKRSHKVETALGPTLDVRANKGAIQQILLNLLQNAAEASPNGTSIRVVTRQQGDRAILEVVDQGSGIPASVMGRMFDPLFTTKAEGTGLGLSIVKRIVDDHAAAIECDTTLAEGTTFRVLFPTTPA
ncbi:MAG TPA: PAS domain S-box protein [Candidatus Thermoplasmatota archaeon]|nr:PAS domain S-box protein [Candidatus Thermoplasmatota archaeon]